MTVPNEQPHIETLKGDVLHNEFINDHDLVGNNHVNKEEITHLTQLSDNELVLQKKLVRKIDTLIMPLVITVYLMNYIDRNNYAAAKLQGLKEDLHMTDAQYQTGLSILFVGYVSRRSDISLT